MTWLKVDAYHHRRECGRYFVDTAIVPESKTGTRHCAWFKRFPDSVPELLDACDSVEEGIRACAAHLRAETLRMRADDHPIPTAVQAA